MRDFFKEAHLEKQFREQGFVVIPFLEAQEVQVLMQKYQDANKDQTDQFYASAHDPHLQLRAELSELIKTTFQRPAESTFKDIELLGGSYIVKPKNYEHLLQAHQDWNIVDEDQFVSCNIWVPLVDTTKNNGAIMLMPKSHLWIKSIRHSSIPCSFSNVHHLLLEHMTTLEIKAGEALIYNHALIHASHQNESDLSRPACALGMKPKEAEMLFYWNNDGAIEEYQSNPEFFMKHNVFAGPNDLVKKRDIDYSFPSVDEKMFYSLSGITPPVKEEVVVDESQNSEEETEKALPFWKVYTPLNIIREIILRLKNL